MSEGTLNYRRSSRCDAGNCVEVGSGDGKVHIRQSGADGSEVVVSCSDFAKWLVAVKRGEFDQPAVP